MDKKKEMRVRGYPELFTFWKREMPHPSMLFTVNMRSTELHGLQHLYPRIRIAGIYDYSQSSTGSSSTPKSRNVTCMRVTPLNFYGCLSLFISECKRTRLYDAVFLDCHKAHRSKNGMAYYAQPLSQVVDFVLDKMSSVCLIRVACTFPFEEFAMLLDWKTISIQDIYQFSFFEHAHFLKRRLYRIIKITR